jgi:hypothetical protein
MRIDFAMFDNPKFVRACAAGGNGAGWLYLQALAYCVQHLTDGWVPDHIPRRVGGTDEEVGALEDAGLWIPLEVTDDGGWLVNDFADYQVTREEWEAASERNRRNAQKRWARRHLRPVHDDNPA